ncbi:hypothetical protein GY45DRAFT_1376535, partial [Cubamyces sp. BRFM 1775]
DPSDASTNAQPPRSATGDTDDGSEDSATEDSASNASDVESSSHAWTSDSQSDTSLSDTSDWDGSEDGDLPALLPESDESDGEEGEGAYSEDSPASQRAHFHLQHDYDAGYNMHDDRIVYEEDSDEPSGEQASSDGMATPRRVCLHPSNVALSTKVTGRKKHLRQAPHRRTMAQLNAIAHPPSLPSHPTTR